MPLPSPPPAFLEGGALEVQRELRLQCKSSPYPQMKRPSKVKKAILNQFKTVAFLVLFRIGILCKLIPSPHWFGKIKMVKARMSAFEGHKDNRSY